jgi:uncharacterized protein DUF5752
MNERTITSEGQGGAANGAGAAQPFVVRDCALIAIATGRRVQNLRELRDALLNISPDSVYYHFWGGLLLPRFEEPEYNNDFAAWARHGLHDERLAERLGVIDPTEFTDVETLRHELVDVIEERMDETESLPSARIDRQFEFIRSQIVVFDTHKRIGHPRELAGSIRHMSVSSIFYHFIDARRRPPEGKDDFRAWLAGCDTEYADLCKRLAAVDPFFVTLAELREQLAAIFGEYFGEPGG